MPNRFNNTEVLAIIPARGGSKGIPRKNLVDLGGKPLLVHSIEAAQRAKRVTRVLVSTDDQEIADVARAHGAVGPFIRPRELAGDTSLLTDAIGHLLRVLSEEEHYFPRANAIFYPTHPFRPSWLVDLMLDKLEQGYTSVRTVKPITPTPYSYFSMDRSMTLNPLYDPAQYTDSPTHVFFRQYGLLTGQNMSRPLGSGEFLYHLTDPIHLVDIDTFEDLEFARNIMRYNLFDPMAGEA